MREIEFRAKTKDKKQWVYGSLVELKKTYIYRKPIRIDLGLDLFNEGEYAVEYIQSYEVIEDTVGEFTGLFDENGQKIYEGDVVKKKNVLFYKDYTYVVEFENGGFFPFLVKGFDGENDVGTYEVIGNIHDNPELLEEEQK